MCDFPNGNTFSFRTVYVYKWSGVFVVKNRYKKLSKKFQTIIRPTKAIAFKNKRVAFLKKKDGYIIEIIEN